MQPPADDSDPASTAAIRRRLAALDPDIVTAADEVDRTLIAAALARSPLERVEFASQMLETLLRFRRV